MESYINHQVLKVYLDLFKAFELEQFFGHAYDFDIWLAKIPKYISDNDLYPIETLLVDRDEGWRIGEIRPTVSAADIDQLDSRRGLG